MKKGNWRIAVVWGAVNAGNHTKRLTIVLGILTCLLTGLKLQGQQTWNVVSYGGYDNALFDQAVADGKWDAYRKKSERTSIEFENGAKLELFSAKELLSQMIPVDLSWVKEDNFRFPSDRIFALDPSGIIIEKVLPADENPKTNPKSR